MPLEDLRVVRSEIPALASSCDQLCAWSAALHLNRSWEVSLSINLAHEPEISTPPHSESCAPTAEANEETSRREIAGTKYSLTLLDSPLASQRFKSLIETYGVEVSPV